MRASDLIRLAVANLLRNRTRSLMTLVGVSIGVAALLALLSYGFGLQDNARKEFGALELYNTLRVTSTPSPFNSVNNLAHQQTTWLDTLPKVELTDSVVQAIAELDGVLAAYPEVVFPVEVETAERELVATAEAVPQAFAAMPAYTPEVGAFFASSAEDAIMISPSMARRLGFDPAADAVGDTLIVTTASLDMAALQIAARSIAMGLGSLPIRKQQHPMRVAGLLKEDGQPLTSMFRVVLPLDRAMSMKKITFFSTFDLLLRRGAGGGYSALRVQLTDMDAYPVVRQAIEEKGVYVSSFRDQFSQLERIFLVMDLGLGIIGVIALLVATIGIANTMMMNVLERYREIGVMKAVGGDERDLQQLFVAESVTLGLTGGLLGLVFGGGVMLAIQLVLNSYLDGFGLPSIQIFHTPPLLIVAILLVAALVSLVAGLAPARRAARIEPIEALRTV